MKKTFLKLLCLLFCLTLCFGVFVGCGDNDNDVDTPVITIDGKGEDRFANADFSGTAIKINMSSFVGDSEYYPSSKYLVGTEEATSDNIMIAVNERNEYIKNKLKLDVAYDYTDAPWDKVHETLFNIYSANQNAPDAICNQTLPLMQLMMQDVLMNCNTSEYTNYFDFTDGTWYKNAMDTYCLGNDATNKNTGVYLLANDYFLHYISTIYAMFVNENILVSNTEWTLEDFYGLISDGDWTWDVLTSISAVAFEDHQSVDENRNGFLYLGSSREETNVINMSISTIKPIIYSADVDMLVYENGKYSYNGAAVNSGFSSAVEKIMSVLNTKGSVQAPAITGDHCNKVFAKNNTLFSIFALNALESDLMSGLNVCPVVLPKYNTDDNYKSFCGEGTSIGAIFNSTNNFDAMSAYWQYQAIKSDKTREIYYVDGLGLKYETGENTTAMLDLIYNSITCESNFLWDRYLGTVNNNHPSRFDNIALESIRTGSNKTSSSWAEYGSMKQGYLDAAIEIYNKLHR